VANEKILILEAPWSSNIADTRATREIYTSAETLLSVHPEPIRIIQRPLISKTYIKDIEQFVSLDCNKRGPNVVILSAHGNHSVIKQGNRTKNCRTLSAFDGDINISVQIQSISSNLSRTIFILDACQVGTNVHTFVKAAGALGAIGFSETVDWIDSSVFILALLLRFQSAKIFHLKRARTSNGTTKPKTEKIVQHMVSGVYKSLATSLGVQYHF
jgi:hypothetical protein